ncbi:hypothetical protein CW362_22695 [Streptomyces populi]|uniref:Uncharacterized protein n=1 Tax=Streptomyces populi TaxID=2058924 RepID=A0A2I0SLE3_9ACTN|nr:hypothetical protein CW362_22695 [Streptomyces populi]
MRIGPTGWKVLPLTVENAGPAPATSGHWRSMVRELVGRRVRTSAAGRGAVEGTPRLRTEAETRCGRG